MYKNEISATNPQTRYTNFYSNKNMKQCIVKKNKKKSNVDLSQYRDPNDDICSLIEWYSNQNDERFDPKKNIASLSKTVKLKIEEVNSIIIDSSFIPFLIHVISNLTPELFQQQIDREFTYLIMLILKYYKPLHIIFFNAGILPIFANLIENEFNHYVIKYSIFSMIFLYNSLGHSYKADFENCLSISLLLKVFSRVKEQIKNEEEIIEEMDENLHQILLGSLNLTSKFSYYLLSNDDATAAFKFVTIAFASNYKDTKIYDFALQTLSYLIENGNVDYDEFNESNILSKVETRMGSAIRSNRILSCDIFVALFEKNYFAGHVNIFNYDIGCFLDLIDQNDEKSYYLRLLASIIKNDSIGGDYIQKVYSPKENERGIRTICKYLLEGNYDIMVSSAHCFIDLVHKFTENMILDSIHENEFFDALVKIILFGLDGDIEMTIFSMEILFYLIDFAKKHNEFKNVFDKLSNSLYELADGFDLFVELDQHDDDSIRSLSTKIQLSLGLHDNK